MAYNHGKEERRWRIWKDSEEVTLRKYGVDESTIEQIRAYDREIFNSDRRFYQRLQETDMLPASDATTSRKRNERTKEAIRRGEIPGQERCG